MYLRLLNCMLKNGQDSKFCVRHIQPHKTYHVAAAVLSYKPMLDISSLPSSSKSPLAQDCDKPRGYRRQDLQLEKGQNQQVEVSIKFNIRHHWSQKIICHYLTQTDHTLLGCGLYILFLGSFSLPRSFIITFGFTIPRTLTFHLQSKAVLGKCEAPLTLFCSRCPGGLTIYIQRVYSGIFHMNYEFQMNISSRWISK